MPRIPDPVDINAPGGPNLFGVERTVYDLLAAAGRPLGAAEIAAGARGSADERGLSYVRSWISMLRAGLAYTARETVETVGRGDDLRYRLIPVVGALQDEASRAARRDAELLRLDGKWQKATRITQALGFASIATMEARLTELKADRQARKAAGLPPAPAGSDLPLAVVGKAGSRKAAIVAALRAGAGAFVSAEDLVRAGYGEFDPGVIPSVKAFINDVRVGLRMSGITVEIPSQGKADSLAYAWRESAPVEAQTAPVAQASVEPAGTSDEASGPHRVWISLAPRGTFFDGDSIIDRDGQKRPRARAA